MWQGKADNGVRPILLSVCSLYDPYCFPAVLILMQTQKLEHPSCAQENKRVSICIQVQTFNLYPVQTRTWLNKPSHRPHTTLLFSYSYRQTYEELCVTDIPEETWTLSYRGEARRDKEEVAMFIRWSLENFNEFEVDLRWVWVSRMLRGPLLLPESSFFSDMWRSRGGDYRTLLMDDPNRQVCTSACLSSVRYS